MIPEKPDYLSKYDIDWIIYFLVSSLELSGPSSNLTEKRFLPEQYEKAFIFHLHSTIGKAISNQKFSRGFLRPWNPLAEHAPSYTSFLTNEKKRDYYLTRFEIAHLLSRRAVQLQYGAVSTIDTTGIYDLIEIAHLELKNRVLPLLIRRFYCDGIYADFDPNKLLSYEEDFEMIAKKTEEYTEMIYDGLLQLARRIRTQYLRAWVPSGSSVGLTAGDSLGRPVTQSVLRKTPGKDDARETASRIKPLIRGSGGKKGRFHIFFEQNNQSLFEIFKAGSHMKDIRLPELLVSGINAVKRVDINVPRPWWYNFFGMNLIHDGLIVRLEFDIYLLALNDVTLKDISSFICRCHDDEQRKKYFGGIAHSPQSEGIVDIYFRVKGHFQAFIVDNFMHLISNTLFRGIPSFSEWSIGKRFLKFFLKDEEEQCSVKNGISDFLPEKTPFMEYGTWWKLTLSIIQMDKYGFSFERIFDAFSLLMNKQSSSSSIVQVIANYPYLYICTKDTSPSSRQAPNVIYATEFQKEFKMYKDRSDNPQMSIDDLYSPPSDFLAKSMIFYITGQGNGDSYSSIFRFIWNVPIDLSRSYTGHFATGFKLLGSEAMRSIHIDEVMTYLRSGGSDIQNRHHYLLSDVMSSNGQIQNAINGTVKNLGITKLTQGHAGKKIKAQGTFGGVERLLHSKSFSTVASDTAAVAIGMLPSSGTGSIRAITIDNYKTVETIPRKIDDMLTDVIENAYKTNQYIHSDGTIQNENTAMEIDSFIAEKEKYQTVNVTKTEKRTMYARSLDIESNSPFKKKSR